MKHLLTLTLILIFSCTRFVEQKEKVLMNWTAFDLSLPKGISVYEGYNKEIPLRAWVAKIDLSSPSVTVKILSSNDIDRRESAMQFLENTGARVVINGGFFNADKSPVQHIGLLKTKGKLEESASPSVIRDSERYFISRGTFGIKHDGMVDIAWCSTKNDSIFEWSTPLRNRPGFPSDSIPFNLASHWYVRDAIHAGPVLINDGNILVSVEDEVFFNTPVAGIQPRSAVGYTDDNYLILMVVDGRQLESRGVYLEELAIMMQQFKCIEAINLDGGGSATMVADSRLLNRPAGRTIQREIMSAIGIFYDIK